MSVQTRNTALQNEIVRLYCYFVNNGVMMNPASQPSVDIIDSDGVTILDTLNAQLETTGVMYVDWFVPANLPLGDYHDRWSFQWTDTEGVTTRDMLFTVFSLDSYINFKGGIQTYKTNRMAQLLNDLSNDFIYEAMHIPQYWEQGMRVRQENQAKRIKNYYYFDVTGDFEVNEGDVYVQSGKTFTVFKTVDQSMTTVATFVGANDPSDSGQLILTVGTGTTPLIYASAEKKTSNFSTVYNFAYKNWCMEPRPIVRLNNRIVDDGWYADYMGNVYFDGLMTPEDSINTAYQFAYFSEAELMSFIQFGLTMMNSLPPASDSYTNINSAPKIWDGGILLYAAITALKRLVFGLNFQEKMIIFGSPDAKGIEETARATQAKFEALYQSYNELWVEFGKNVKTRKIPPISQIAVPEYTLPGGRSRWFRYLYK